MSAQSSREGGSFLIQEFMLLKKASPQQTAFEMVTANGLVSKTVSSSKSMGRLIKTPHA